MREPSELYELVEDEADLGRPVLVQTLTGFVDAGNATFLAREHLRTALDARLVATFDADQLIDYRSRRPPMIFLEDHWEHYEEPSLGLYLLRDDAGTPFLMLAGPEPDLQWERFIAAVFQLVERFSVGLTVGLNAIPMAFVCYFPALYILRKHDPLGLPSFLRFASPLVAALAAVVAGTIWRIAVRHYRSTGS